MPIVNNGKLNLDRGFPLYPPCQNDPHATKCTNCGLNCKASTCDKHNCDAHGTCQCVRSECLCR